MRVLLLLLLLTPLPAQAAELKLATWNIAWLTLRPAGDPALPATLAPRGPQDFDRLRGYAARLDADVVALQEVDGAEAAARVFDPRAYAFFFAAEADVQRVGFAVRRGLEVTQHADLAALDLRPQARFSQRRGVDISVGAGPARLRLLAVHLNAGCRDGPLDAPGGDCATTSRQVEILADWVAQRRREGGAFALLGDFNRRIGAAPDPLLGLLEAAAPLRRATAGASDPCWADLRGARPFIDHILLGGEAQAWVVPDSLRVLIYAERGREWQARLSDHCPVSIRLRPG